MAQVAALAMYLKVLTMPVAYITLARGQALAYLILESLYCVALILLIIFCYQRWGLYGTGVAVTLAYLFDFLIVMGYAYKKNGYRCSATVFRYAVVQVLLGLLTYTAVCLTSGITYWLVGGLLILLSTCYSLHILRRKTHLWQALTRRLHKSSAPSV
jgi:Na+-driven multidrug efflux pump